MLVEAGKRSRKFFADLKDARSPARLVATKIENQERQVLTLTPEDARIYADALATLRPLKVSLDSAVRELVASRGIVGDYPILEALKFWKKHHDSALAEKRVAEVVAELVKGLESDGASPAHVSEMERALGKFADAFQRNIDNVATAEINAYLRDLAVVFNRAANRGERRSDFSPCHPRLQRKLAKSRPLLLRALTGQKWQSSTR